MKIARMNPYEGNTKTRAFFDLETEEGIIIKGFTLIDGPNGLFAGIPNEKGKDGNYYDKVIFPAELKKQLNNMALHKYDELKAHHV